MSPVFPLTSPSRLQTSYTIRAIIKRNRVHSRGLIARIALIGEETFSHITLERKEYKSRTHLLLNYYK